MNKKTKIVCTLGPATSTVQNISKLLQAGMNVARLNFSHGNHSEQLSLIKNIRLAALKTGLKVAIMQDLQGPKIRLGLLLNSGLEIKANEQIILDTSTTKFSIKIISKKSLKIVPVQYKQLHRDVKKGDTILIEDGLIETKVNQIIGNQIFVTSLHNCLLKSHKGINVPTASISASPLTKKDLIDLKFGLKNQVDLVALSFVRRASDITQLRTIIKKAGSHALIVAKIERHEAITNIESIVKETDAVMVARGDLGVETPAVGVPIIQKRLVKLSLSYGKPVIIATEMLQSMIEKPRATRAEVSDAANSVFDHADAVMLSNETAVGKYPTEAVQTLANVAISVEKYQQENQLFKIFSISKINSDAAEICHAANVLAHDTNTQNLVVLTKSGFTAFNVAKGRGPFNIICITPNPIIARQLNLVWGINHIFVSKNSTITSIKKLLIKQKLLKKSEKFVLISNANSSSRAISLQTI